MGIIYIYLGTYFLYLSEDCKLTIAVALEGYRMLNYKKKSLKKKLRSEFSLMPHFSLKYDCTIDFSNDINYSKLMNVLCNGCTKVCIRSFRKQLKYMGISDVQDSLTLMEDGQKRFSVVVVN